MEEEIKLDATPKEWIHNNEIETLQSQLKEVTRVLNIEKKVRQSLEERVKILEQDVSQLNYCNEKLTEIINKRMSI